MSNRELASQKAQTFFEELWKRLDVCRLSA